MCAFRFCIDEKLGIIIRETTLTRSIEHTMEEDMQYGRSWVSVCERMDALALDRLLGERLGNKERYEAILGVVRERGRENGDSYRATEMHMEGRVCVYVCEST